MNMENNGNAMMEDIMQEKEWQVERFYHTHNE